MGGRVFLLPSPNRQDQMQGWGGASLLGIKQKPTSSWSPEAVRNSLLENSELLWAHLCCTQKGLAFPNSPHQEAEGCGHGCF